MTGHLMAGLTLLAAGATVAAEYGETVDGLGVGPVEIRCAETGGWSFSAVRAVAADGVP